MRVSCVVTCAYSHPHAQKFVDSESGATQATINPATARAICAIPAATVRDVDRAIRAARAAFDTTSAWRQMNARDRGRLMYRLADLMEQYKVRIVSSTCACACAYVCACDVM